MTTLHPTRIDDEFLSGLQHLLETEPVVRIAFTWDDTLLPSLEIHVRRTSEERTRIAIYDLARRMNRRIAVHGRANELSPNGNYWLLHLHPEDAPPRVPCVCDLV